MSTKIGGTLAEKSARLGKSDSRYWANRLEHPACTKDGVRRESSEWAIRIMFQYRREYFTLGTSNKAVAAKKAVDIWASLISNGWEVTLNRFKRQEPEKPQRIATVGEFLDAVQLTAELRPKTYADYARSLRLIASEVAGMKGGKEKFAPQGAKRGEWLAKVHAISLSELTLDRIQKWKLGFLAKGGMQPDQRQSRARSVNSLLRQAKSLFAPRRLKFIRLQLPSPLPFEGIEMERQGSSRYISRFDVRKLVDDAGAELADAKPEQYMIFLLAVNAGLRRNEIDKLEWSAVDLDRNTLVVSTTEFLDPKSHASVGEIELEPEFVTILRRYQTNARGRFVIEADRPARTGTAYAEYRCEEHFKGLIAWLRAKGGSDKKPLHALRKEFGSLINELHGIYAASQALRHADIGITTKHYVENRKKVTPGLGGLLRTGAHTTSTQQGGATRVNHSDQIAAA